MSRKVCEHCHYPLSACVCDGITKISPLTEIVILQHPSELKQTKNTVRLIQLVIPSVKVVVGESEADFINIKNELAASQKSKFLVYPSETSVSASEVKYPQNSTIILIDGTWKKAYKILMLNPWLLDYTHLSIDNLPASNYIIRKSSREDSLSTLEATSAILQMIEPNCQVCALDNALSKMVSLRVASMPSSVQKRYK